MTPGEPLIRWDWLLSHAGEIGQRVGEHLELTLIAVAVGEAARGMGYNDRQILWRVELPLALAVIFAGIRIATITTIGLVTVTALIGQGGMGYFILLGIQLFFSTALIVGALGSVILAVLADGSLVLVQRALTPWTHTP